MFKLFSTFYYRIQNTDNFCFCLWRLVQSTCNPSLGLKQKSKLYLNLLVVVVHSNFSATTTIDANYHKIKSAQKRLKKPRKDLNSISNRCTKLNSFECKPLTAT
jgi:hypothetical protein